MRKRKLPTVGRNSAESFFVVPIRFSRQRKSPGLARVRFGWMRLGLLLYKRLSAIWARSDPRATVEPSGSVGFVSGHGEGGASFQRERHDTRRSADLKFQFFRKRRHGHAPSRIRALRSGTCVTNVLYFGIGVG